MNPTATIHELWEQIHPSLTAKVNYYRCCKQQYQLTRKRARHFVRQLDRRIANKIGKQLQQSI